MNGWQLAWSGGGGEEIFLVFQCSSSITGDFELSKTGMGAGGPNQPSSINLACPVGTTLLAVGFYSVDSGTELTGARPIDTRRARVSWVNDGTRDNVGISLNCL